MKQCFKFAFCAGVFLCALAFGQTTQPSATPTTMPADTSAATRKVHPTTRPGDMLDITIDELGNFDYDADHGGNIPKDVIQLSGCNIRTRGYMVPLHMVENNNVVEFALVPRFNKDAKSQALKVQGRIIVHLPNGKAVPDVTDLIQVEGKLTVGETWVGGSVFSIFDIDPTSIRQLPTQP
jgi:hypothetical protein